MDKYTGKRLDGRYEIQELIGIGGMAYVYKAYDSIDDRTVAIKILKEEYLGNQDFMRRFKNESKAIAMLDHPNIVKVFSVSFGDRMQYIVMEYIDGITLKEYVDRQENMNQREALHFTVQILRALQHAHENGIIHRDIKPQNIMLLRDGTIKVTDFGIARFSDSQTRTMTDKAIGSVHYIAPEQARGDLTDGKTDVYSVGVMLYEMITGKLPFEAENAVSVALMQLQTDPTPPREINPAIPVGLEEITLKAMRKLPAERYGSAREMLQDISAFRRDPMIRFNYHYAVMNEAKTKVVDSVSNVVSPEQRAAQERAAQRPPIQYQDRYTYQEEPRQPEQPRNVYTRVPVQQPPQQEEEEKKSKAGLIIGLCAGGAGLIAAVIIGLVLIFGGAFGGGTSSSVVTEEVDLPNFVGKTLNEAQTALSSEMYKDLKVKIEYTDKSDKDEGTIVSQNPTGGKRVKRDIELILTVSSGSKLVEIPDVKNYTEVDAVAELTKANLKCTVVETYDEKIEEGHVIKTSPAAHTKVPKDTKVTIYLSKGTKKVTVPNVVGDDEYTATSKIQNANLSANVTYEFSDTVAEGIVISSDPNAGTELKIGDTVTLKVSKGKEQKETTVSVGVNLPGVSGQLSLDAYLDGVQVDSEKVMASSGAYSLNVTGEGSRKLEVYLDGSLYATYTIDFDKGSVQQTGSYAYDSGSGGGYGGYVDPNIGDGDYGEITN